jgi:hypothetical protein
VGKRKSKRNVRCLFCNAPFEPHQFQRQRICPLCQSRGRRLPDDDDSYLTHSQAVEDDTDYDGDPDENIEDEMEGERLQPRRFGHKAFFIGMGTVLVLWLALAGISLIAPNFLYVLIVIGVIVAIIGMFWLFHSADEDGLSITAYLPRNPMILLIVVVVQAVAAPIFTVVYLFFNFEEGWKPAVVQVVGAAMVATGFLMLHTM